MMREKFIEQLQTLYRQMTVMGGLCQQAIAVAVRTLEEEEETAEKLEAQVFALDGEVDDMEREIETLCTKLLLKQQPVAADLRRITAALKMVTDLERIGDQASDIAELARFIRKGGKHEHLHEMAREVIRMVSDAVEAFVHLDLEQARAVIAYDDVVDRWFNQIKSDLVEQIAADKSTGKSCWTSSWSPSISSASATTPRTWLSGSSTPRPAPGPRTATGSARKRRRPAGFNQNLTLLWFLILPGFRTLEDSENQVKLAWKKTKREGYGEWIYLTF